MPSVMRLMALSGLIISTSAESRDGQHECIPAAREMLELDREKSHPVKRGLQLSGVE
jgi:hypothetical protein